MIEMVLDLARNLGQKGDWTSYRDLFRESFRLLVDLERHSSRLRQVQSEIIPGLLQTEAYRRALHEAPTPFHGKTDVDAEIHALRYRQSILTRESPTLPTVSFALSESCLRRAYGGPGVMREQMQRLIEIAEYPNVQLQVLPFGNSDPVLYASLDFCLIHVPGPGIATPLDFVYVEQYDDARYLDDHDRVEAYEQLWGYVQAAALDPLDSVEFIGKVADQAR